MLYSHSKSFTSTAIGFLVDDGKLDLDARVLSFFPDKAPAKPSANLRALRVRDLLTMNVGASVSDPQKKNPDGDWVRIFLANDIEKEPGTVFKYDSCATHMLAAIAERVTGMKLMDFLKARLFDPLGMTSPWSTVSPTGVACGGWGMNMTTRDLARFGQLYLDQGMWEGKRLLSREWVALATARQTWSGAIAVTGEDGSDWHQGYGFQFWRCRHNAFRADGASGQYTIVMPEQDAVVSIHAGLRDMQQEINLVWDHLLPAFGPKPLPEDAAAQQALAARCAALKLPVQTGSAAAPALPCANAAVSKNPLNVKSGTLEKAPQGWALVAAATPSRRATWNRSSPSSAPATWRRPAPGPRLASSPCAGTCSARPSTACSRSPSPSASRWWRTPARATSRCRPPRVPPTRTRSPPPATS